VKREARLTAMIGMVGELQGIMGQAMPEIAAIDGPQGWKVRLRRAEREPS
jgi:hypothetical protein